METTSKRILNFTKEMQIEKLPYFDSHILAIIQQAES